MSIDRDKLLEGLDDERALFGLFFAFGNRLQAAGDTFYEEITCKQFFLLICLSVFQGTPPMINELADVMGSSHQNVKQLVNKLEKAGFVTTFYDKEDRRKVRVAATEKIGILSDRYREQEEKFMTGLYDGVTKEEVKLTYKVMTKIEKNLMRIGRRDK
ncbi:DNA-binding MarR family transcriptional regulator [Kineothrix alysoides]|uniref:DNA-binding MarR family transcriptional regulator n=1 Tax=Kineothrix alysoides TaxID=1469948 RepID=A0A4R1QWE9_9FIRM|nr:MarR family transcriptional regulator [Kineothrix alysoides]TCL58057.1 DNA-binding MarR family transcriptional regulator [Kineothrix alysoides]